MHEYIFNQINQSISFEKDEIKEFFNKESSDQVTLEELEGFH